MSEKEVKKSENASEASESFNLAKLEEKTLDRWDAMQAFEKSLEKTADGKPFTFYDGPPFATGLPHYGHILASTIKDVIPRYQTMQGRFVRRRWGWDCHGLPIEEIVERELGISGKKQIEAIGIKKFNETCRSMVLKYVSEWRAMVCRIARWVDFDNSYKTMDTDYMESVWWAFKQIYDKDLIYEGRKVLLYCPRCETPVSNFEVAMDNSYKDVSEESVYVKFKVKAGQKIGDHAVKENDKIYILAWTTTPWTLPGNVALAVGADIPYVAVEHEGEYFILAAARLNSVGLEHAKKSHDLTGAQLVGLEYEPLFEVAAVQKDEKAKNAFKVYAADFVTTEEGTGIVHTAVVYGEDDYNLGAKVGLPVVPLLDEKGIFNDKAPKLVKGQYFKKADPIVINDLHGRGLLFKKEFHTHSYPFCWRCGPTLFYNAIPAWFVNVQKIKPQLLKTNEKEINWYPGHLKHGRYEKSVEAAPDWNISRNRYWGNPVPVWKCAHCKTEVAVGSLSELAEHAGPSKNAYWIMRHGEAESNMFDILDSGQRKYLHLTPRGKEEVEKSAAKFHKLLEKEGKHIDVLIHSDITRTTQTADITAAIIKPKHVELDKRIEEIHLGPTLTGYRDAKYSEMFPAYADRFHKRPEKGESLPDLRTRTWEFLRDCEAKYEGKNILIVSHDYPTWMLTQAAEGWSEARAIEEIKKRDGRDGFIDFAEIRPLTVKNIPRNDTGEADMHRPYIDEITFPCKKCGKTMARTPEIFDSWMEAGSMPFAEYHYPFENEKVFKHRFPAQFVSEYIAQTRAWFYVMHVNSEILFGHAPFENVVTTGTILAEDGSKMSKSKKNFPDPQILIDKYGADSLRFYLMNSVVMQADNLNFSEQAVATIYRKVALILWNVAKFFTTYAEPGQLAIQGRKNDSDHKKVSEENILDKWIKIRTNDLVHTVTDALNGYDTVRATRVIQEYIDDLSTWYLRRSRKRKDPGFLNAFYESLMTVTKVIAPFMPFLADELYAVLKPYSGNKESEQSVHLSSWPKSGKKPSTDDEKLLSDMAEVRRLASLGLSLRSEAKIKVRQPLASLTIKKEFSHDLFVILAEEVNVKKIEVNTAMAEEIKLDTAITSELREEGMLRELIRMIQGLRQEAGLDPKDDIAVHVELAGDVKTAAERNEAFLKDEVGARTFEFKRSDAFQAEQETKIDGQSVWIGIRKI
ncbi:MAG TPA: class I tRNA ligase family protein [Candidatus Paceibacterota bacterium]|nr:class I tRNA ligase family protein [Candidatus Paceibacterota bacterium]